MRELSSLLGQCAMRVIIEKECGKGRNRRGGMNAKREGIETGEESLFHKTTPRQYQISINAEAL